MRPLQNGELILFGTVGDPIEGFTDTEVVAALASLDPDYALTVRINSGGGFAHEGVAIYNALMGHPGRVTVRIDGVAASAASLIAMAGDEIVAMTGSLMMIHDPSLVTIGTVDEHQRGMHQLDKTAAAMATIYASRTGKSLPAIRTAMAAEVWMTAPEAVAEGYADRVGSAPAKAAASFDYAAYAHTPWPVLAAMQAQARADSPAGRAGAAGWAKAVARLNGPAAVEVDPATERAEAIRTAAAERGVATLGEDLIGGKLPVAEALARLHRYPAAVVMTSAVQGSPTLGALLAGRRGAP